MKSPRSLSLLIASFLVAVGACGGGSTSGQASPTTTSPVPATTMTTAPLIPPMTADNIGLAPTTAPAGYDVTGAQWIEISRPDGHSQLAAMFLPAGPGPSPTVVFLHGASGLALGQLQWAPRLAAAGYLVLAACYLAANADIAAAAPGAFVPCPGLPPDDLSDTASVTTAYRAVLSTAHALGATRPGPIGVVGVSYGAGVALDVTDPSVAAIVADSGYGTGPPTAVSASVLFLGNTTDPNVAHGALIAYEQALRTAGKTVDSHYYDGTGHVAILTTSNIDDATQRIISFLDQHLK